MLPLLTGGPRTRHGSSDWVSATRPPLGIMRGSAALPMSCIPPVANVKPRGGGAGEAPAFCRANVGHLRHETRERPRQNAAIVP